MDLFDAIAARGSYRDEFLPEEIPQDALTCILTAGIQAPSGYNYQTTSIVAVTDAALRKEIAALMPSRAVETAPVILVLLSEHQESPNGLSFEIEDYAACAENLLLAITALGYAGVWMDGRMKLGDNRERIERLLCVPAGRHARTIIPFGRPAQSVCQKEKRPLSERVTFNRF